MSTKATDVDHVIVLTLISIIIAGLCSILPSIISSIPWESFFPKAYTSAGVIQPSATLPGLDFHSYPISNGFRGRFYVYIEAYAQNTFSIYLYNLEGKTILSAVNTTTVCWATNLGSMNPYELEIYTVKIYNPNLYDIDYEIHIELRPIG